MNKLADVFNYNGSIMVWFKIGSRKHFYNWTRAAKLIREKDVKDLESECVDIPTYKTTVSKLNPIVFWEIGNESEETEDETND